MPAASPPITTTAANHLDALGAAIKGRRIALGLSMTATAEAAGISRVTLHRIERGVPAVTVGAYMNTATALGLRIAVAQPGGTRAAEHGADAAVVRIGDYPQLRQLAWNLDPETALTEEETLRLYERNWRHIDQAQLTDAEQDFIDHLADIWGHGRLLV